MNIALIGSNSSAVVSKYLTVIDSLSVTSFKSTAFFMNETSCKTLNFERILVLQDSVEKLDSSALDVFAGYVCNKYTETRVVCVCNKQDLAISLSDAFPMGTQLVICAEKMTSNYIINLATQPLDSLRKQYASDVVEHHENIIKQVVPDSSADNKQQQTNTVQEKPKRGLFGFKGKKKRATSVDIPVEASLTPSDFPSSESSSFDSAFEFAESFDEPLAQVSPTSKEDVVTDFNIESTEDNEVSEEIEEPDIVLGNIDDFGLTGFSEEGTSFNDVTEAAVTSQASEPVYEAENASDTIDAEEFDNGFTAPIGSSEGAEVESDIESTMGTSSFFDTMDTVSVQEEQPEIVEPAFTHTEMRKVKSSVNVDKYDFSIDKDPQVGTSEPVQEVAESIDEDLLDSAWGAEEIRSQYAQEPKVVEKIVEKQVFVDTGTNAPLSTQLDMGKQAVVVVTGDRRSGATLTALNIASLYAKRVNVLYVDFDIEHFGAQLYLGVETLIEDGDNIKDGLCRVRNSQMLSTVVHDTEDGYKYLYSLLGWGTQATDEDIIRVGDLLLDQQVYNLVIVDCPFDKLHLLDELLLGAKVLFCVDSSITGCVNSVDLLNSLSTGSKANRKFCTVLSKNLAFITKAGGKVADLEGGMYWVRESFMPKDLPFDWTGTRIIGESSTPASVLDAMKKF